MRVETVYKNVYTLDEVKDRAIEKQWDINVDHDWWDYTYGDAADVGIKITSFDLDRSRKITGEFTKPAHEVMQLIIESHGDQCATYQTAQRYLSATEATRTFISRVDNSRHDLTNKNAVYDKYRDCEEDLENAYHEFLHDLLADYLVMLDKEYEYLTGAEAIEETLRHNEYEFYEDGTIY